MHNFEFESYNTGYYDSESSELKEESNIDQNLLDQVEDHVQSTRNNLPKDVSEKFHSLFGEDAIAMENAYLAEKELLKILQEDKPVDNDTILAYLRIIVGKHEPNKITAQQQRWLSLIGNPKVGLETLQMQAWATEIDTHYDNKYKNYGQHLGWKYSREMMILSLKGKFRTSTLTNFNENNIPENLTIEEIKIVMLNLLYFFDKADGSCTCTLEEFESLYKMFINYRESIINIEKTENINRILQQIEACFESSQFELLIAKMSGYAMKKLPESDIKKMIKTGFMPQNSFTALVLCYSIFKKYNVNPASIFSSIAKQPLYLLQDVVKRLQELEKIHPGCASVLQKDFNIDNFNRYPTKLLVDQYENIDSQKPYGIIINPKADYNAAFAVENASIRLSNGDSKVLTRLHEDLSKEGILLRICEINGRFDLARTLIKLNKRYGKDQKIKFVIIGGHGTAESISFGGKEEYQKLSIGDLSGEGGRRIEDFLDSEATVVLNSCSTGKRGGIGQRISKVFDRRVIAPEDPASINQIEVKYDADKVLKFSISYSGTSERVYMPTGKK